MPSPTRQNEPEVRTVIDWDPESTKSAEISADSGDIKSAADLAERIMVDDRAKGLLLQRASIVRFPLRFEGGSAKARKRLKADEDFWRIIPAVQLQQFCAWYALFGVAVGRLNWVDEQGKPLYRDGKQLPVMQSWSTPRHLNWDSQRRIWESEVGWVGTLEIVTPGANGWLLWTAASDRPWAQGAWKSCRPWWLLKQYAIEDWARHSEVHGKGIFDVETQQADTRPQRQKLASEFRTIGASGVWVHGPGQVMKLVESVANTFETFRAQIDAANTGMAIAIMAQNLTSEVKGGSYAAAQTHSGVAASVTSTDAEALSDFVYAQLLKPWAKANYGSEDAAPWPVWDTEPPEDDQARVKVWVDLGAAIEKLRAQNVPIDVIQMAETAACPLTTDVIPDPPEEPEEPEPEEDDAEDAETEPEGDDDEEDGKVADARKPQVEARLRHHVHNELRARKGERQGQAYTDSVAESMQMALALEMAPHLKAMLKIAASCGEDYNLARAKLEAYYAEKMDPDSAAEHIRAGLLMCQLGGWASVRVDAPELKA